MRSDTCPACGKVLAANAAVCPFCGLDINANRMAYAARQQQENRLIMQQVKSEQKLFGIPYETASEQAEKISKGRMLTGILLTGVGVVFTSYFALRVFVTYFGSSKNEFLPFLMAFIAVLFGCMTALGVKLLTPPKHKDLPLPGAMPQQGIPVPQPERYVQPSLEPPPAEYDMGGGMPQPETIYGTPQQEQQIQSIFEATVEDGTAPYDVEHGNE